MSDGKLPISACLITRNEAGNVADCIRTLDFAAEVVVVDSRSTDATRDIARSLGARVIERDFAGHVPQKQFAVDSAQHDWVFCIDADERVDPALAAAIRARFAPGAPSGGAAGFEVARHVVYLGRPIDHGGWWPEWRLRLFDRRRGRWGGIDPHDHVQVDGAVERLPGELTHFNFRDLTHHVEKINAYASIIADRRGGLGERFSIGKLVFRPPARFVRMYLLRAGFRDGMRGFVLAWMGAFYVFLKYAKLWESEAHPGRKTDRGGRPIDGPGASDGRS